MGEFKGRIGERQLEKTHIFVVRKYRNSESCNSARNRRSKGKCCKAEENKCMDILKQKIENSKWEIWI